MKAVLWKENGSMAVENKVSIYGQILKIKMTSAAKEGEDDAFISMAVMLPG